MLDGLTTPQGYSANGVAFGSATLASGAATTAAISLGSADGGVGVLPESAIELIVDIYATSPTGAALDLFVMDPVFPSLGVVSGYSCSGRTSAMVVLPASGLGLFQGLRIPFGYNGSVPEVTVGQCGSSSSFTVGVVLRGYVENPTSIELPPKPPG
jgi:hypothetical protein